MQRLRFLFTLCLAVAERTSQLSSQQAATDQQVTPQQEQTSELPTTSNLNPQQQKLQNVYADFVGPIHEPHLLSEPSPRIVNEHSLNDARRSVVSALAAEGKASPQIGGHKARRRRPVPREPEIDGGGSRKETDTIMFRQPPASGATATTVASDDSNNKDHIRVAENSLQNANSRQLIESESVVGGVLDAPLKPELQFFGSSSSSGSASSASGVSSIGTDGSRSGSDTSIGADSGRTGSSSGSGSGVSGGGSSFPSDVKNNLQTLDAEKVLTTPTITTASVVGRVDPTVKPDTGKVLPPKAQDAIQAASVQPPERQTESSGAQKFKTKEEDEEEEEDEDKETKAVADKKTGISQGEPASSKPFSITKPTNNNEKEDEEEQEDDKGGAEAVESAPKNSGVTKLILKIGLDRTVPRKDNTDDQEGVGDENEEDVKEDLPTNTSRLSQTTGKLTLNKAALNLTSSVNASVDSSKTSLPGLAQASKVDERPGVEKDVKGTSVNANADDDDDDDDDAADDGDDDVQKQHEKGNTAEKPPAPSVTDPDTVRVKVEEEDDDDDAREVKAEPGPFGKISPHNDEEEVKEEGENKNRIKQDTAKTDNVLAASGKTASKAAALVHSEQADDDDDDEDDRSESKAPESIKNFTASEIKDALKNQGHEMGEENDDDDAERSEKAATLPIAQQKVVTSTYLNSSKQGSSLVATKGEVSGPKSNLTGTNTTGELALLASVATKRNSSIPSSDPKLTSSLPPATDMMANNRDKTSVLISREVTTGVQRDDDERPITKVEAVQPPVQISEPPPETPLIEEKQRSKSGKDQQTTFDEGKKVTWKRLDASDDRRGGLGTLGFFFLLAFCVFAGVRIRKMSEKSKLAERADVPSEDGLYSKGPRIVKNRKGKAN